MTELFKTVYLNYDKSTFLIDLVKHSGSGKLYIELKQLIHEKIETTDIQVIKINPAILDDILRALLSLRKEFSTPVPIKKKTSYKRSNDVIERYYKGISIKDLALQIGYSTNLVEQILIDNGIEIVSNELPKRLQVNKKLRSLKLGDKKKRKY